MAKIPINEQPGESVRWSWRDDTKAADSDDGRRTDVYHGGDGGFDGPGHIHSFVTTNDSGEVTQYGADGRDGRDS